GLLGDGIRLGELEEMLHVAAPDGVGLLLRGQPLARILADRLPHLEPRGVALEEAVVKQRRDPVERGVAHRDRGLEREAAAEDGQLRKECLLVGPEEVVAPGDRLAERAVPLREVPSAAAEQVEALVEQGEHRVRRQELRARRCELYGERETVEARADLLD